MGIERTEKVLTPEAKLERYKMRQRIGEILFDADHLRQTRNIEDERVRINIKGGEVQAKDFMDAAKIILEDEELWGDMLEKTESVIQLHGVKYIRELDKELLRNELAILVEQHEALG